MSSTMVLKNEVSVLGRKRNHWFLPIEFSSAVDLEK
jgi:hypothetical protein